MAVLSMSRAIKTAVAATLTLLLAYLSSPETTRTAAHLVKTGYKSTPKVKAVTFATPSSEQLCTLIRTALSNDIEIKVLGLKMEDSPNVGSKNAIVLKPQQYLLESQKQAQLEDADTLFVYLDGFDTFFQDTRSSIRKAFDTLDHAVVWSAEKNCHPPKLKKNFRKPEDVMRAYRNSKKPKYKAGKNASRAPVYLNSGVMLCQTHDCYKWFNYSINAVHPKFQWDDQFLAQKIHLSKVYSSTIDYFSKVSQSVHPFDTFFNSDEMSFVDGQYKNTITGTVPGILHFPGTSRRQFTLYNDFERRLRYDEKKIKTGQVELEEGVFTYEQICGQLSDDVKSRLV
ncbi:MAG: hypothetical protein SGCHY_002935 [Lobulomycetales sp.]